MLLKLYSFLAPAKYINKQHLSGHTSRSRLPFSVLAFVFLTLASVPISAQTGPGGVAKTDGTSTLNIWLDAESTGLADGVSLTTWSDMSGYGNNFVQAVADSQPQVATGVLNGLRTVRFDGGSNILKSGTLQLFPTNSSPLSVIVVFDTDNNDGQKFLLTQTVPVSDSNLSLGYDTGLGTGSGNFGLHRGSSNASLAPSGTIANDTFSIMTTVIASSGTAPGNISIFKNGSSQTMSNDLVGWFDAGSYRTDSDRVLVLGGRSDDALEVFDSKHDGDIAEVLVFKGQLNDVERVILENYLSSKYNLTLSAGDKYSEGDGSYDVDVIGIGHFSSNIHQTSQRGGLYLDNNSALDNDDEWLFGGHY